MNKKGEKSYYFCLPFLYADCGFVNIVVWKEIEVNALEKVHIMQSFIIFCLCIK